MGQTLVVRTPEEMHELGRRLAASLRAGDVVLLSGELGAGKTTLAAGVGAGLGVRGRVTSPTFVIAREHPSMCGGPPLVHVDAYRLGGLAEVDDLDLDSSLDAAVTLVEWGTGLVEQLTQSRLEVRLERPRGGEGVAGGVVGDGGVGDGVGTGDAGREDTGEDAVPRTVRLRGVGPRWASWHLPAA